MTRILVTIGPASAEKTIIKKFSNFTNLFRLNGSHNNVQWHRDTVAKIRKVVPEAFILLDIPGAKPRTSNTTPISIKKGETVIFGNPLKPNERVVVGLTKPLPSFGYNIPSNFSVNDGQYLFDTVEMNSDFIAGTSRGDFVLLPKKGVNLPESIYCENLQLQICRDFIKSVSDIDVNGFGLSFIQSGSVVESLREVASGKVLISKIENSEGLKNSDSIISCSDAVMIDRGDLAAEIGFDALYNAIEKISSDTKSNGKPLIMATENLESMSDRDTPSKSEVMSLAHSVSIGSDCIMLSEETATSENCLYIVEWLAKFLHNANVKVNPVKMTKNFEKYEAVWEFVAAATTIPILLVSKSGHALFNYMAIWPGRSVTIITNNGRTRDIAKLFSGDVHIIGANLDENAPIQNIWQVIKTNSAELFRTCDHFAAVYVSKYVKGARANSITVFHKDDFTRDQTFN